MFSSSGTPRRKVRFSGPDLQFDLENHDQKRSFGMRPAGAGVGLDDAPGPSGRLRPDDGLTSEDGEGGVWFSDDEDNESGGSVGDDQPDNLGELYQTRTGTVLTGCVVVAFLSFAVTRVIFAKGVYQQRVGDVCGVTKLFGKPLFLVGWVLVSMMLSSIGYILDPQYHKPKRPLVLADRLKPALPAAFSLASELLYYGTLLYLPASSNELVAVGTELVVAAAVTGLWYKREHSPGQWVALFFTLLGMLVLCASEFMDGPDVTGTRFISGTWLIFVIIRMLTHFVARTLEEWVLFDTGLSLPVLVSLEGAYGAVLLFGLIMPFAHFVPGQDCGRLENWRDTIQLFLSNSGLFIMVAMFASCVIASRYLGLTFVRTLGYDRGSVVQAKWAAVTPACVLVFGQLIYYVSKDFVYIQSAWLHSSSLGEKWKPGSIVSIVCMIMVVPSCLFYYTQEAKRRKLIESH